VRFRVFPGDIFDGVDHALSNHTAVAAAEVQLQSVRFGIHAKTCQSMMPSRGRTRTPRVSIGPLEISRANLAFPATMPTVGIWARGPPPATAPRFRIAHPIPTPTHQPIADGSPIVPPTSAGPPTPVAAPNLAAVWTHPPRKQRITTTAFHVDGTDLGGGTDPGGTTSFPDVSICFFGGSGGCSGGCSDSVSDITFCTDSAI